MLDLTKPLQTRDGKPARLLSADIKGAADRIIALVDTGDEEIVAIRYASGTLLPGDKPHDDDLINVPEQDTFYVNLGQSYSTLSGARNVDPEWPVIAIRAELGEETEECIPTIARVLSAELA